MLWSSSSLGVHLSSSSEGYLWSNLAFIWGKLSILKQNCRCAEFRVSICIVNSHFLPGRKFKLFEQCWDQRIVIVLPCYVGSCVLLCQSVQYSISFPQLCRNICQRLDLKVFSTRMNHKFLFFFLKSRVGLAPRLDFHSR